uniref:PiggyBac transposable element-derived protein domain-containing protein n=1 Tax=Sinocyclocheilus grahami TaxID=75366 RepID=A0A672L7S8_SINGR
MDVNHFYGTRTRTLQALVPENPQDSDADLSDADDPIEDPDYHPVREEVASDSSFESLDEDDAPSTSTSFKKLPCTKRRKGKHSKNSFLEGDRGYPWLKFPLRPTQWHKKNLEMIQHVAHHTNLYSAQELGDPIKTSPEEIEDFLSMLLFMGVFKFPSLEDYWHNDSRFSVIADIMPRKRFQLLRRYIHFNDNQQCSENPDRFYKIRPLFDMLRKQCLLIPSTYKHSVDEVMIGYKGTRAGSLCQYIANKPDKWGFKVFCRASSSGIIHDLLMYQGASTFFNVTLSEEEQMLPIGAKVVTTLCKTIQQPRLSVVFFDNFLTSFKLVQTLQTSLGVQCIGTVRPNRTGGAPLMTDKELIKRGRGSYDYRSAEGVIAVKWFDNKCVNLLSNASGIMPLSAVERWCKVSKEKITVPCPSLIPAYNEHMGGINLSDMLVHLYRTPAKSRRWYIPLFRYILDLSIANSWLVYKRECGLLNEKAMPLKWFRLAVAHSLNQKHYTPRPSLPKPQPDVRYDSLGHWPLHYDKRGRNALQHTTRNRGGGFLMFRKHSCCCTISHVRDVAEMFYNP